MNAVWIVDDDRSIRWVLEKSLARENIAHRSFSSASEALTVLDSGATPPQVLISDIHMPGESGLVLLQRAKEKYPNLPVIIMTAYSDLDSAVSAFQGGAFEYLPKPFDVDQALDLLQRALKESTHQEGAEEQASSVPEILGQAASMQEVFRAIGRLSQSSATVMINGESGTGKELVARALHRHSPRKDGPFVAINTAAIPKDLLESELFGHERGAFTGAAAQRRGRFEQAEGGTLFLDEIGDMPAELQTRLLRVLSDGHFYRVGGHTPVKANVRVIAATHQHLEQRVRDGLFREDLFHRLDVIRLRLPPLRERREDVPLLAKHFLAHSSQELGVETKRLTDAALKRLQAFDFPGNVRQLENLCHWLTVMAPGQSVDVADLPAEMRDAVPSTTGGGAAGDWLSALNAEADRLIASAPGEVFDRLSREFEKSLILRALASTGGRRVEAAQVLGIGRNTITRKIQELGIDAGRNEE
ncbi:MULTISPECIES: nitrogen regulation protein NR(I) [Uliginosibacterium]|uniref:DNA-binding transcriptional regulator NtrC n=1 Tax=Uliginosibacterium aquaticum TaxID=2731212 RepID=A0ABX2IHI2_9RHOO|nr:MULTISPECIES: nitrogen regulation protein NR(I) [Uliginosibacterium]MDO6387628.1 nitrogen regulation protein NR(I) [Uliginosibacterium sp. 31-12]NSL56266.1 nitrogen regulation protein NR(I) [Uliginosibacterium aquaticum]PLK47947.1 nitrogen regulation protein NR(I) [Uliginosibacterium sp. TH139]